MRRVAVSLCDSLHRFLGGGGVHSGQRHGTPVSVGDPIVKAPKGAPDPEAVTVHARSPDRDVGQQGLPQAAHLVFVRRPCERGRHAGLLDAARYRLGLRVVGSEVECQPQVCVVARLPGAVPGMRQHTVVVIGVGPEPLFDAGELRLADI